MFFIIPFSMTHVCICACVQMELIYLAVSPAGDASLDSTVGHKGSQQSSSSIVGLDTYAANLLPPRGDRLRVP